MTTPTHIPPAMRGEGVPEWIVPCDIAEGYPVPKFLRWMDGGKWRVSDGRIATGTDEWDYEGAEPPATPTEITAARDGGRGDV